MRRSIKLRPLAHNRRPGLRGGITHARTRLDLLGCSRQPGGHGPAVPVAGRQVHELPFQCSMTPVAPPVENPTAQALRAEVAVTLTRRAVAGLSTRAHDVPFQRSMRLASRRGLSTVVPTAQALVADSAVTLARLPILRAGLAASVQDAPFQCSINAPLLDRPAVQALVAETAAMPLSAPPAGTTGPGTCRQAVPFQCSISGIMPVLVKV